MAGAAGASTARYSTAYKAGARGAAMPKGLAELADEDPNIDLAYDAGQAGTPYEEFLQANDLAPTPAPRASQSGGSGPRGSRGRSGAAPRRGRPPRRPSVFRPTQGIPKSSPSSPLAPLSAGPVPIAHAGAGLILGAVFYALVLSVIDYGPSGPKAWFNAKFLNQPTPKPAP